MNAQVKSPPVTFAEAFCKLQAEIRPAIKDATNPAFRSKYADLGAVWEAVKQPLTDNGFSIIQSPQFEGETMWLETTILHISGNKIEGRYPLKPTKPDPQGFGSAITYARRYSLSAMLGVIADIDDDGNEASAPAKPSAAAPQTQRAAIHTPMQAPADEDTIRGSQNWVDQEKPNITACERLPEMYQWLDENGESWTKPTTGSALYRLQKSPAHFEQIKAHYLARMAEINKGNSK